MPYDPGPLEHPRALCHVASMRAIMVRQHGGLEELRLEQVPDPTPGPMEVLVAVRACGVNYLDTWVRRGVSGHHFPLPLVPGSDVAGEIAATGAGVTHLSVGDKVVVAPATSCGHCVACLSGRDHHCRSYAILGEHRDGGYAEFLRVPAKNAIPMPRNLDFVRAAGVGIAFLTAWHMLIGRAELRIGETVLIQAAGSGVGSAAVQIAKLWGARVIATAGSDEKLARAKALGADEIIHYGTSDVAKEVKRLTAGQGCNVVVEHVGPATWQSSLRALGWQGRLVTCGATTGSEVALNLNHLFFKAQSILGSTMGSLGEFREILGHVERGVLRPVIDRVVPFTEAKEAHRLLEERRVFGKIVLTVE